MVSFKSGANFVLTTGWPLLSVGLKSLTLWNPFATYKNEALQLSSTEQVKLEQLRAMITELGEQLSMKDADKIHLLPHKMTDSAHSAGTAVWMDRSVLLINPKILEGVQSASSKNPTPSPLDKLPNDPEALKCSLLISDLTSLNAFADAKWSPEEVRWLMSHELTHLRDNHAVGNWLNAAKTLVGSIYLPGPLNSLVDGVFNKVVTNYQENVADNGALTIPGNALGQLRFMKRQSAAEKISYLERYDNSNLPRPPLPVYCDPMASTMRKAELGTRRFLETSVHYALSSHPPLEHRIAKANTYLSGTPTA